jgi:repressor LexA
MFRAIASDPPLRFRQIFGSLDRRVEEGMMILTKRQKQLYDYIDDYIASNGYAPTLEEIGERFQLSSLATVHKHLSNLEQKGLIRRKWNFSRAIELVPKQRKSGAVELPLLGLVAAGQPIEALESDDTFCVPEEFIRRQNTFVLRVKGSSMIEDGICDGDYIVVEERQTANDGETVVALIDGAATVKRFHRQKGGKISLMPANQTMQPIIVKDRDVTIRGVVVAVMRKY